MGYVVSQLLLNEMVLTQKNPTNIIINTRSHIHEHMRRETHSKTKKQEHYSACAFNTERSDIRRGAAARFRA